MWSLGFRFEGLGFRESLSVSLGLFQGLRDFRGFSIKAGFSWLGFRVVG